MKQIIIHLKETDSTNDYLRHLPTETENEMTVVVADYQSAGRGQGTNSWESEAGKNLLFSLRIHPRGIPVGSQFLLSMAGSLALHEVLSSYAKGFTLKWPNDIYWNNSKVSGTLIETTVGAGGLKSCIFGVGINVNQRTFRSDAPNPLSLCAIVGHDLDCPTLLKQILAAFEKFCQMLERGEHREVSERYHEVLYRRKGFYAYRDAQGVFEAALVEVENDGHLVLRNRAGELRRYAFKEVEFILN
ncbi:MAG TPA: biotin--[acetyl-CoA-carboxylase] ligase [Prevotella sp.]